VTGSSRPPAAAVTWDGWTPPPLLDAGPTTMDILGDLPHRCAPADVQCDGSAFTDIPWVASRGNYPAMFALARMLQPRRILELGTLYGYGLCSWLRGAGRVDVAIALDAETYFDGGYLPQAYANVLRAAPDGIRTVIVRKWDTAQGLPAEVMAQSFDLVIVDGDHTEDGKRRDLRLAWDVLAPGGWLFVDDIHSMPQVQRAVAAFVGEVPVAAMLEVFTRTTDRPRGAYLLQKGAVG
jgi:predicted O-methyltransferase YrrM